MEENFSHSQSGKELREENFTWSEQDLEEKAPYKNESGKEWREVISLQPIR